MAKILVVEDVPSLQALYRKVLEHDGHSVLCARNPLEAIELLEKEAPRLVVLDVKMPGTETLEAALRLLGRDYKLHLVLISSATLRESEPRRRVADAFVSRSPDMGELRASIAALLDPPRERTVEPFPWDPSDSER